MKEVHSFNWQWRLSAAAAVSVAMHLAIVGWVRLTVAPPPPLLTAPLAIRLREAAPPMAPRRAATHTERHASTPVVAHPKPAEAPSVAAAAPAPPAGDPALAPAAPAPENAAPSSSDSGLGLTAMPGRYRVRMPPPAVLEYTQSGAATPAGAHATIAWQNDGDRYKLSVQGVLGDLTSVGASGDAGILPAEAVEHGPGGSSVATRFDLEAKRIVFGASQQSYPIAVGNQDRASVLMQLSGIGLGEPDQMHDVIEIFVAGSADATVARYQVLGKEEVQTGLGKLASWHLVQLARPGQRRLELWLAPDYSWYPVMLRATEPDGTQTTQVLDSIAPAPPLG